MLGYALVERVRSLDLGVLARDEGGPDVAGGAILTAAAYQLSPLKKRGLRRCRDPRAFVSEQWRPGPVGALRMGIEHGRVCVAWSWALMAALFALGVMNVGWMVLVAALMATEKLLPWRTVATRGIAAGALEYRVRPPEPTKSASGVSGSAGHQHRVSVNAWTIETAAEPPLGEEHSARATIRVLSFPMARVHA